MVDGRVGLDRAGRGEAGERVDRAVERGDDADRQRLVLAERAADRRDRRADDRVARGAERQRPQRQAGGIDLQQRDVGERVEADDLGRDLVVVLEAHVDLLRLVDRRALAARHDVRVRGDLAVAGDHEPRADAGLVRPAAVRVVEARARDRHDARRLALVDRRRVERRAARLGVAGVLEDLHARRGRLRADRPRLLLAAAAGDEQRGRGGAGGQRAAPHAGSSSENVVRPGTLSARSSPSIRSASSCAIARPRPDPCASSEV